MGIRFYHVSSPGTRNRSVLHFEEISILKPEKSLTLYWITNLEKIFDKAINNFSN